MVAGIIGAEAEFDQGQHQLQHAALDAIGLQVQTRTAGPRRARLGIADIDGEPLNH